MSADLMTLDSAELAARLSAARIDWEHAVAEDRACSTVDTRRRRRATWAKLAELSSEECRRMWLDDFPL